MKILSLLNTVAAFTSNQEELDAALATFTGGHTIFWVVFFLQPLMALGGYFRNRQGITRGGLWGYLFIAVILVVIFKADRDIYGRALSEYSIKLENQMRVIALLLLSYGIGKRARNAGYKWWLAGLSAVPLISLPMIIHLLFFKQKRSSAGDTPTGIATPTPLEADSPLPESNAIDRRDIQSKLDRRTLVCVWLILFLAVILLICSVISNHLK